MEEILNALISSAVGIIVAVTGLIIAYINRIKDLQEDKRKFKEEIKS